MGDQTRPKGRLDGREQEPFALSPAAVGIVSIMPHTSQSLKARICPELTAYICVGPLPFLADGIVM
jgi:hypothetical protein